MEQLLPAQYLQLIPMVIALVAMVRNRLPKIDGHETVLAVTAVLSVGLCFLAGGDTPAQLVKYGIMVALAGAGGMQALKYHATKSGETVARLSLPPPPKVPSIRPERGFVRLGLLFAIAVGGLLVACAAKPLVCPIVKVLDEACPFVIVELPDGTKEPVPREQVSLLALRARAARGAHDAGSDR